MVSLEKIANGATDVVSYFVHRVCCCLNHFVDLHGFRNEVMLAECGLSEILLVPFRSCLIVFELDLFFFYLVLPHELKEDLIA